jgi:hypothetical protein
MKSVVILRRAHADLEKGREFYELREAGLGNYFVASLYDDIVSLASLHGFHPQRHGYLRLLARRFPFGIYYRISGDVVYVAAVIDLRARPSSIKREIKKRQ